MRKVTSLGRRAATAYIVLLHIVVGVLVLKTNFVLLAERKLGVVPPREMSAEFVAAVVEQARRDAALAGAALIVLGDSIAEALDPARIAGDAVNYGLSGDSIRTLLYRLPVLRSVERARGVVLSVGVNDLNDRDRAATAIAADYRTVLARLPHCAPVVAVSVLPVDETSVVVRRHPGLRNPAIRSLNAALRPVCEARPNCRFLDVWPVFLDRSSGGLRSALHGGDGLHLSPAGNRALEGLIKAELAAIADPGEQPKTRSDYCDRAGRSITPPAASIVLPFG